MERSRNLCRDFTDLFQNVFIIPAMDDFHSVFLCKYDASSSKNYNASSNLLFLFLSVNSLRYVKLNFLKYSTSVLIYPQENFPDMLLKFSWTFSEFRWSFFFLEISFSTDIYFRYYFRNFYYRFCS